MNAALYPKSAATQMALGDLWLAKKDSAKARGYYERAIALHQGAQRAKDMVGKLKAAR